MLKKITLFVVVLLISISQVFAQADTVTVPSSDSEGPVGALSRFILGDTTSTGERVNPDRVYSLIRGEKYYQQGEIIANFPLKIISQGDPSVQKPVICPFPLDDGSIPAITIEAHDDILVKDVHFLGVAPTNERTLMASHPIDVIGDGIKAVVKGCIVEDIRISGIYTYGENISLFIEDCIWKNNNRGRFDGEVFFNEGGMMDTVSIVNTTWMNGGAYFLCLVKQTANYVRFEHNTVFNSNSNAFYTPYLYKGIFQNNIFFNCSSTGVLDSIADGGRDFRRYDWDGERSAVFSIDTLPTVWADLGLTEADREITLTNNAYFWSSKIKDYIETNDTVLMPVWINNRTTGMFDDDQTWPHLIRENNVEADPGFSAEVMRYEDSLLAYVRGVREFGREAFWYAKTPFPGSWPLESLAYTNSELLTASTLGFPLGDLNWFPDKKAEWEEIVSGVEKNVNPSVVKEFSLSQNYPNPFNPTTTIEYTIPANVKGELTVKLIVYDILGREVTTLVNKKQKSGIYKTQFDASNLTSGVYLYKLKAGDFMATKKLMLLK